MPEPFSVATAAFSIAVNAHGLCQNTVSLISGIRDAPASIQRLSADLKGVDVVICMLSEWLKAHQARHAKQGQSQSLLLSVQRLLSSCIEVVEDLNKALSSSLGQDGQLQNGLWARYMWEAFRKDEVAVLQKTLFDYKQTLSLACAILNYINSTITIEAIKDMQLELHKTFQQTADGQSIPQKYQGPMERFLEETETVILSDPTEISIPKQADDDDATVVTLRPEDAIDERLERLQLQVAPSPQTRSTETTRNLPFGSIATVSREQDHIHNFCVDADGYVQEAHWQPAFNDWFHGWFQRGNARIPRNGRITAVSYAVGHIHLFATDVNGKIVGCEASPADNIEGETWSPWEEIAGGMAPPGAHVEAVVWEKDAHKRIELFVCGNDGQVSTIGFGRNVDSKRDEWSGSWVSMRSDHFKAIPGCHISAVSRLSGHLDVFLADVDGRVMTTARGVHTNGWLHWWEFGIHATPGGVVTALVQYVNRLDIFTVNQDGVVCNAWWDGARPKPGWNWWNGPNEIIPSTKFIAGSWITAVTRSKGQIDLFGVDKDDRIVAAANTPDHNWIGWWHVNDEYGNPGSLVAACVRQKDHLDIVSARKADKKVITAAWSSQRQGWFAGWWQIKDLVV